MRRDGSKQVPVSEGWAGAEAWGEAAMRRTLPTASGAGSVRLSSWKCSRPWTGVSSGSSPREGQAQHISLATLRPSST